MKRIIKHKIRQSIMAAISLSDSKRRSLTVTRQRDTRAVGSNDSKRARAAPRRPVGPATHAEWRKNGGAKNGRSALLGPRGRCWLVIPPAACTLHRRGLLRAASGRPATRGRARGRGETAGRQPRVRGRVGAGLGVGLGVGVRVGVRVRAGVR